MFAVTIYTLRELPFNKPSYVESSEIIEVDAESFQFGYELSQDEFSVGDTVKFNVTTRDVTQDRKSTRLNSSHVAISYAVFCLKKKNKHVVTRDMQLVS